MPKVPSYSQFMPASELASRTKRANRREGGRAEQRLAEELGRRGMRFRRHAEELPGKPDFVFPVERVCVFCDGDFWHGRDWDVLRERLMRRSNPAYWVAKIGRNVERDREQTADLRTEGWLVLRLWETDVLRDPVGAADQVGTALLARSSRPTRTAAESSPRYEA